MSDSLCQFAVVLSALIHDSQAPRRCQFCPGRGRRSHGTQIQLPKRLWYVLESCVKNRVMVHCACFRCQTRITHCSSIRSHTQSYRNPVDLALGLLDLAEFEDPRNCIKANMNEFIGDCGKTNEDNRTVVNNRKAAVVLEYLIQVEVRGCRYAANGSLCIGCVCVDG